MQLSPDPTDRCLLHTTPCQRGKGVGHFSDQMLGIFYAAAGEILILFCEKPIPRITGSRIWLVELVMHNKGILCA